MLSNYYSVKNMYSNEQSALKALHIKNKTLKIVTIFTKSLFTYGDSSVIINTKHLFPRKRQHATINRNQ